MRRKYSAPVPQREDQSAQREHGQTAQGSRAAQRAAREPAELKPHEIKQRGGHAFGCTTGFQPVLVVHLGNTQLRRNRRSERVGNPWYFCSAEEELF